MALVLKVKYENTLRRWVVPEESLNQIPFSLTLQALEAKIRDLFNLSPSTSLIVTYIDKENDVVTLGDDQDIIDACVIQRLNPLRLEVQVASEKQKDEEKARGDADPSLMKDEKNASHSNNNNDIPTVDIETLLTALFPQATLGTIRNFLQSHTAQFIDPKLTEEVVHKAEESFKEVLNNLNKFSARTAEKTVQEVLSSLKKSSSHKAAGTSRSDIGEKNGDLPHNHEEKKTSLKQEDKERNPVRHEGVQCDICNMVPIVGPRYKSTKLFNYDLCSNCFEAAEDKTDYQKLDRPASGCPYLNGHRPERHHQSFQGHCRRPRPFMHPHYKGSFARGPYAWKPDFTMGSQSGGGSWSSCEEPRKLDARFVKDVTIFDGTEVAPNTKFTKIWRVSNSGTLAWPQGVQLVHIGGDTLSTEDTVNVELPQNGLPCGEDVEVSIDLLAPEKAGRYVSHWRLASQSGQKFGHRLWVVIQVVPAGEQSPQFQESLKKSDDDENKEVALKEETQNEVNDLPIANPVLNDDLQAVDVDLASEVGKDLQEEKSAAESTLHIANTVNSEPSALDAQLAVYDFLDGKAESDDGFSLVEKPIEKADWLELSENVKGPETVSANDFVVEQIEAEIIESGVVTDQVAAVEQMHLQSLESMGFSNQNLNLLLLQKNGHDLQKTVEDLITASGWDGALKDLEEMGFTDHAVNVQVLVKNEGSIKRAVKELVNMEKL